MSQKPIDVDVEVVDNKIQMSNLDIYIQQDFYS